GDAVLRDAGIDLHDERFGFRDAARRQPRAIRAGRGHRTAAAEAAAFFVAAARRRAAGIAKIPDEAIHARFDRQRRRQRRAATAAAASPAPARLARVAADDLPGRVENLELHFS